MPVKVLETNRENISGFVHFFRDLRSSPLLDFIGLYVSVAFLAIVSKSITPLVSAVLTFVVNQVLVLAFLPFFLLWEVLSLIRLEHVWFFTGPGYLTIACVSMFYLYNAIFWPEMVTILDSSRKSEVKQIRNGEVSKVTYHHFGLIASAPVFLVHVLLLLIAAFLDPIETQGYLYERTFCLDASKAGTCHSHYLETIKQLGIPSELGFFQRYLAFWCMITLSTLVWLNIIGVITVCQKGFEEDVHESDRFYHSKVFWFGLVRVSRRYDIEIINNIANYYK